MKPKQSVELNVTERAAIKQAARDGYLTLIGGMNRRIFARWFVACKKENRPCISIIKRRGIATAEVTMITSTFRLRKEDLDVVNQVFVQLGDFRNLKQGHSPGSVGPITCVSKWIHFERCDEAGRALLEATNKSIRDQREKAAKESKIVVPDQITVGQGGEVATPSVEPVKLSGIRPSRPVLPSPEDLWNRFRKPLKRG